MKYLKYSLFVLLICMFFSLQDSMGPYKNYLQASKNSLTGAKFYGNWYI